MQNFTNVESLQNATVYGSDGDKIGSVGQVYLDDQTNQPTFVTVHTGLFGMKETFIPVSQATSTDEGLQVPFDKAFVKGAPNIDADGALTPEEERRIYDYYSMDYQGTARGTGRGAAGDTDATEAGRGTGYDTGRDQDVDAGLAASSGTAASGVSGLGVQRGRADDTAADLDRDTAGRDVGTERAAADLDRDTAGQDVDTDQGTSGRHVDTDRDTADLDRDTGDRDVDTAGREVGTTDLQRDTGGQEAGTDRDDQSGDARDEQPDVGTGTHGTSRLRLRKHTYVDIESVEGEEGTSGGRR
jgi:sporulation protein YlmC with PRC-barrel domain